MAEKMSPKDQAQKRYEMYAIVRKALEDDGVMTETIADGVLIHLGDEQYGKLRISICDPTKFDLEKARKEYAEKQIRAADKARKSRERAEEREKKAMEKATAAAEKIMES